MKSITLSSFPCNIQYSEAVFFWKIMKNCKKAANNTAYMFKWCFDVYLKEKHICLFSKSMDKNNLLKVFS